MSATRPTRPADRPVTGYASGVFDMFHVGHLNLLTRARAHCDVLVAGVGTDEYVTALKGRAPVVPFEERLSIVASLRAVDVAVPDHAEDKVQAWHQQPFDVIFKGDDWRGTAKGERLEAAMAGIGVRVEYFPYTVHTSSTLLRSYLDAAVTAPVDAALRTA